VLLTDSQANAMKIVEINSEDSGLWGAKEFQIGRT